MKCENLYMVNCFLDRETEVLDNMNAISLELKLTLQEYKLFFLQKECSKPFVLAHILSTGIMGGRILVLMYWLCHPHLPSLLPSTPRGNGPGTKSKFFFTESKGSMS